MRKLSGFSIIILCLMLASCNSKLSSTDFTPENSFTEGVEGPATDANGNIYAVDFTYGLLRIDIETLEMEIVDFVFLLL